MLRRTLRKTAPAARVALGSHFPCAQAVVGSPRFRLAPASTSTSASFAAQSNDTYDEDALIRLICKQSRNLGSQRKTEIQNTKPDQEIQLLTLHRKNKNRVHRVSSTVYHRRLQNPADWTLAGFSVAGLYTVLYLVEPGIMVDCGRHIKDVDGSPIVPPHLLITHHHGDHVRNYGFCKNFGTKIIDPVTDHKYDLLHKRYDLDPTTHVRTFPLDHTVSSVGYGIHHGTESNRDPQVLMMGDTRIDPFYEHRQIYDYPVIVVECTNYDHTKDDHYRKWGHINWTDIKPIIVKHPDITFHLIHPSQKISQKKCIEYQKTIESLGIRNAFIWIGAPRG